MPSFHRSNSCNRWGLRSRRPARTQHRSCRRNRRPSPCRPSPCHCTWEPGKARSCRSPTRNRPGRCILVEGHTGDTFRRRNPVPSPRRSSRRRCTSEPGIGRPCTPRSYNLLRRRSAFRCRRARILCRHSRRPFRCRFEYRLRTGPSGTDRRDTYRSRSPSRRCSSRRAHKGCSCRRSRRPSRRRRGHHSCIPALDRRQRRRCRLCCRRRRTGCRAPPSCSPPHKRRRGGSERSYEPSLSSGYITAAARGSQARPSPPSPRVRRAHTLPRISGPRRHWQSQAATPDELCDSRLTALRIASKEARTMLRFTPTPNAGRPPACP